MRFLGLAFLLAIVLMVVLVLYISGQEPALGKGMNIVDSIVEGPASSDPTPVKFNVYPGDSAATIAQRLERERIIKNSWSFELQARWRGLESRLEVGEYVLSRDMKVSDILARLQQGRYIGSRITIPEGWRATQIADLLQKEGAVGRDEFLKLMADGRLGDGILPKRPPGSSLEGYLFPDTYQLSGNVTASRAIEMMLQTFSRRFDRDLQQRAGDMGLTVHQVVTLASIVEREAVVASERPLMAGVYLNRLEAGMRLEADPTVQYAVAETRVPSANYWKAELTKSDLAADSPYNTYRYTGLPPGPISNPGLASLQGVLEAENTDYLYFVAREDGSHVFAKTFDEHLANVQKYSGGR